MGNKGVKDQQRLQMYYKSKCWDPRTDSFDAVAAASNTSWPHPYTMTTCRA